MATNAPDTTPPADPPSTATPSATFERIIANLGFPRRPRQDTAVALAHHAVAERQRIIVQAPTGVGKSLVALATAADVGCPGAPGIVVTTTNSLGNQYLTDCRRFAAASGFSYTRVMGASNYACADSDAARSAGIPGSDDVITDDDGHSNASQIRTAREQWLIGNSRAGADPANQWELRTLGLDDHHRCPGYPDCAGNSLGGCGAKHARRRGFDVDVVISNFHMLAFTHRTGSPLLPLATAAVVVVDEAHELAETIADIYGGHLTPDTGRRVFAAHDTLRHAVNAWVTTSLTTTTWGSSRYDTAARVPVDLTGAAAFARAYLDLPDDVRTKLDNNIGDNPNSPGAGDVLALLRAFSYTALPGETWRAWTERTLCRDTGAWTYTSRIALRRVDSAARIVPALLPAAAVLLTGTAGETLPARLGLADVAVHDLGQEFDWATVRGRVSTIIGTKTGDWKTQVLPRQRQRVAELADAIRDGDHRAALVLANAHDDVTTIARHLAGALPEHRVFTQTSGTGSLGAGEIKHAYVEHIRSSRRGVLIGTNSFATGLDLPGDLCTFVAWWSCHRGVTGYYENEVDHTFRGYVEERFRARFAQGIGRLLRSADDHGEVMICDSRGEQHIRSAVSRVDQHLQQITWTMPGAVA